jgi:hypothetical protein
MKFLYVKRPGFHAFRASRPALALPSESGSGSGGVRAVAAARAARRAALKPYRKFSHAFWAVAVLSRLMLYT